MEFHESNERFAIYSIKVCTVCIHLLANGEYNDGTDAAEMCAEGLSARWPHGEALEDGTVFDGLVPGLDEYGFSTSACEGCGDTLHDDRFEAFAFFRRHWIDMDHAPIGL